MISGQARKKVREARRFLSAAASAVELLHYGRGSPWRMGIALLGVVEPVLDAVWPTLSGEEILRERGYVPMEGDVGAFVRDVLASLQLERRVEDLGDEGHIVHLGAAAWIDWGSPTRTGNKQGSRGTLYARPEEQAGILTQVRDAVWAEGTELSVEMRLGGFMSGSDRNTRGSWRLLPLSEAPTYIGSPKLDYYVRRLGAYGDKPRTVMLIGPSGVGKTLLVRCLARERGHKRLLKLSSSVLAKMSIGDLLALANLLGPDVLLIDDAPFHSGRTRRGIGASDDWLALLEAVYGAAPLVVLTFMEREGEFYRREGNSQEGKNAFDGLRPERVDIIWRLQVPSKLIREQILLSAFPGSKPPSDISPRAWNDLLERTIGLTGAYLKELALRLQVHGAKGWKTEVANLLTQCVPSSGRTTRIRRGVLRARRPGKSANDYILTCIQKLEGIEGSMPTADAISTLVGLSYPSFSRGKGPERLRAKIEALVESGEIEEKEQSIDGPDGQQKTITVYAVKGEGKST